MEAHTEIRIENGVDFDTVIKTAEKQNVLTTLMHSSSDSAIVVGFLIGRARVFIPDGLRTTQDKLGALGLKTYTLRATGAGSYDLRPNKAVKLSSIL